MIMRSKNKLTIIIICILLITIISFITQITFAGSQLSIVDIDYSEDDKWHTSILYSDNRLLIWNEDGEEEVIPNVKKRIHTVNYDFKPDYLTTNNELFYDANSSSGNMKKINNVVDFRTHDNYNKFTVYKDTNNSLHYLEYPSYGEQEIDLDELEIYNFKDFLKLYNISHSITDYEENNNQVTLYVVFNSTCGVCKAFIQYLSELDSEVYNKFKIVGFEINDYYNNDVFLKMSEIYGISVGATPTTIIGDTVYEGYSELKIQEMIEKINIMYEEPLETRKDLIKECNSSLIVEPVKLSDNVNQFEIYGSTANTYLIYTTNDKKAYIYGDNPFGNEINAGEEFTSPYLLIENVRDIGEKYLLTEDNSLYIIDLSGSKQFVPLSTNVKSIENVEVADRSVVFYAKTTSDTNKYIYADIRGEIYESYYGPTITSIKYYRYPYEDTKYLLSDEGKLYTENTSEQKSLTEIKTNVKEISKINDSYDRGLYYLTNSGELYYTCYDSYGCSGDEFLYNLTDIYDFESSKHYLVLTGVETIKYLDKNFILMTDGSVYRIGRNYSNEFKGDYKENYSYLPVQIDELINNGKEITANDIIMRIEQTEVVENEIINYKSKSLPVNSNDKILTIIDDTNIVTKDGNKLKAINVGETQICAQIENNQELSLCENVKVYPKITSISIDKENVTFNEEEYVILNIEYTPENTLASSLNLEYKVNGEYTTNELELAFDYIYDENDERRDLKPTEIAVAGYEGGTYELELHQVGCDLESCYDTVTMNIEEYVSRIYIDIDKEYYDGINNAYMFINEKETLQVNHEIYTDTATNKKIIYESSNTSVATISDSGLITAHEPGTAEITLTSEDGRAKASFILTVYDYSKVGAMKGDVNKDGEVNILDVIKLRKYLAGLEDLES